MKNIFRLFLILTMFVIICVSLCGCNEGVNINMNIKEENTPYIPSEQLIERIEATIPNAKFLNVTDKEDANFYNRDLKVYHFTNGEFDFEIEYGFVKQPIYMHVGKNEYISKRVERNNYIKKLFLYKKEEILELVGKHNIIITEIKDYEELKILFKENKKHSFIQLENIDLPLLNNEFVLNCFIFDTRYIDNLYDFFVEVEELLNDYIPENFESFGNIIDYSLECINDNSFYLYEDIKFSKNDLDIKDLRNKAKIEGGLPYEEQLD